MTCDEVRGSLLESDAPEALPGEVRAHVATCAACSDLARRVARLEASWRELPVPASSELAREAFLRRLAAPTRPRVWWISSPVVRWAIAVSVLFTLLLGGWLGMRTPDASAMDVLDSLVDWNVALAEAPEGGRSALAGRESELSARVSRAQLSAEDLDFAQNLLIKGAWLAHDPDPMAAADHFDGLAEVARQRFDRAVKQGHAREADRWARHFTSLDERGMQVSLERGKKKGLNPAQAQRLDQLAGKGHRRRAALHQMVEESPEPTRHELRRSLGLPTKKSARPAKGGT